MPNNEARALAAMVLAHYPGSFVNEMNVLALADTFERIGLDIAPQVAERARVELQKPPSSAQLYELAREVRAGIENERKTEQPSLSAAEAVEMPEEIIQRIHEMTDPDRRRREREAEIAGETAEWERKKTAARFARKRTNWCDGSGKEVQVLEDGRRICPDCGTEVLDIEAEPLPATTRRKSWKTGEWT